MRDGIFSEEKSMQIVRPTKQYFPFYRHPIGILLYGRKRGKMNGNLNLLQTRDDVNSRGSTCANMLAQIISAHDNLRGVSKFFAPVLDFSGTVSNHHELTEAIPLPEDTATLFRSLPGSGSDGVEIPPGAAGIITGADCPVVTFFLPKYGNAPSRAIATHGARWALVNRQRVLGETGTIRPHEGLVEGAVEMLGGENAPRILVHIALSIAGKHFRHPLNDPRYADINKLLIAYISKHWGEECFVGDIEEGMLHLPFLIAAQCIRAGIPEANISWDEEDTYGATEPCSTEPKWWSHRRESQQHNGRDADKRNLVLILH